MGATTTTFAPSTPDALDSSIDLWARVQRDFELEEFEKELAEITRNGGSEKAKKRAEKGIKGVKALRIGNKLLQDCLLKGKSCDATSTAVAVADLTSTIMAAANVFVPAGPIIASISSMILSLFVSSPAGPPPLNYADVKNAVKEALEDFKLKETFQWDFPTHLKALEVLHQTSGMVKKKPDMFSGFIRNLGMNKQLILAETSFVEKSYLMALAENSKSLRQSYVKALPFQRAQCSADCGVGVKWQTKRCVDDWKTAKEKYNHIWNAMNLVTFGARQIGWTAAAIEDVLRQYSTPEANYTEKYRYELETIQLSIAPLMGALDFATDRVNGIKQHCQPVMPSELPPHFSGVVGWEAPSNPAPDTPRGHRWDEAPKTGKPWQLDQWCESHGSSQLDLNCNMYEVSRGNCGGWCDSGKFGEGWTYLGDATKTSSNRMCRNQLSNWRKTGSKARFFSHHVNDNGYDSDSKHAEYCSTCSAFFNHPWCARPSVCLAQKCSAEWVNTEWPPIALRVKSSTVAP